MIAMNHIRPSMKSKKYIRWVDMGGQMVKSGNSQPNCHKGLNFSNMGRLNDLLEMMLTKRFALSTKEFRSFLFGFLQNLNCAA